MILSFHTRYSLFAGALLLGLSTTRSAYAATFTVTSPSDTGPGSLRQAILDANSSPGDDTIAFGASLAGATVSLSTIGDSSFGPSALGITSNITIQGLQGSSGVTIARNSSGAKMRLFTVASGASLTLRALTLSGGIAQGGNGGQGGTGGGGGAGLGGAIFNDGGSLTIDSSTLVGNTAQGGLGGSRVQPTGFGGGGGGGLGGNGGTGAGGVFFSSPGAGGGGTIGNGADGITGSNPGGEGGTGGSGGQPGASGTGSSGGFINTAGGSATGTGGGGGGTGTSGGRGGNAGPGGGGGGGGGGGLSGDGGDGGFGGGGGGTGGGLVVEGANGGDGGFGGGGGGGGGNNGTAGATTYGKGGFGGGNGSDGSPSPGFGGGGGGAGLGGALFNNAGTVSIVNSTFTTNSAIGGAGSDAGNGQGLGGAIFARNGTTTLQSCTLSGNAAAEGGGAIYARGDEAQVRVNMENSILANSISTNDYGRSNSMNATAAMSFGGSLIEAGAPLTAPSILNADPQLGPLASNGGPTQTFAISRTSPAYNAGNTIDLNQDQRGLKRRARGREDIGSFELQNNVPVLSSVTIAPIAPTTNATLNASVAGESDADGDTLTRTYQWKKNGVVIAGETGPTLDLSKAGNGDRGDSITVTVVVNDGSDNSEPVTSAPVTIGNLLPEVSSVTPANAADKVGAKRTFTLTVSDGDGASDIKEMWLLINERLSWNAGATLIYVPSATSPTSGLLYLRKGDAFLAPIQIGEGATASAVLDSGAVRVVASEVQVIAEGNSVTLSLPLTIRDGLVGNNRLFGRVVDGAGATDPASLAGDDGYIRFGTYTVTPQFSGGANSAPILSRLTPGATNTTLSSGVAPAAQTFSFAVKDDNGSGDLESLWFLAGKQRNWTNSATFIYQPRSRRLYLRSDDGNSFLGGAVIGTSGILENSQVRVDLSKVKTTIYPDGKTIGLSLPLQAKSGLLGQNKVWLRAQDNQGATAPNGDAQGYVLSGTWNVTQATAPNSANALSAGHS